MNNSPFALTSGTNLSSGFRIDTLLGQGGYGLTYGGQDLKLNRPVAIKEFFPVGCEREGTNLKASGGWLPNDIEIGRARFLEEGRALARFRHEGIVPVYSAFEDNETAYLVMEWLHGQTLSQMVEFSNKPLPVSEAVELMLKVADALSHVHEAGLLHRDIKPDNVLRSDDKRVVLLDFGLATDFNRRGSHTTRQLQMVLSGGTPGYAPLEQYSQRADLTPATDVYALSATLYFLLTGQEPLSATDRAMGTLFPEPHSLNDKVSSAISNMVLDGMALEAARRPISAKEWATRLQNSASQPSSPTARPSAPNVAASIQTALFANVSQTAPVIPVTLAPLTPTKPVHASNWKVVFSPSQHHSQGITDLDFAPSQGIFGPHILVTAGQDSQVFVWDIDSQQQVRNFEHPAGVLAVRFSANGQFVFAGCDDQKLYVWDVESGRVVHVSDKFKYPVVSLAVSPNGNQIAIGCEARGSVGDWQGFIFDGMGQTLIRKLPSDAGRTRTGYISSLDYSPNGQWLAQGTFGAYTIWDASINGTFFRHFEAYGGSGLPIQHVRFTPDGENLGTYYRREPIKIWNVGTDELVRSYAKVKLKSFGTTGFAFSPQEPLIAIPTENRNDKIEITLLDVASAQQIQKLPMNTWQSVDAISFLSDGQLLAAGSNYDDPTLRVFGQAS